MQEHQIFYAKQLGEDSYLLTPDWEKSLLIDGPSDHLFALKTNATGELCISVINNEAASKQLTIQLDDHRFVNARLVFDEKTIKLKPNGDTLTVEITSHLRQHIIGKIKRKGFLGGFFKTNIENWPPKFICD
jgi:hypothetical protein